MKALTVLQPWASLIVCGAKQFETRSWRTPYRGPLLIHAGRRFPATAKHLAATEPFSSALKDAGYPNVADLPLGAIVGVVQLQDCIATDSLEYDNLISDIERQFGDFRAGRWGWKCGEPEAIIPHPYQGILGLFEVPDVIAKEFRKPVPGSSLGQ